MSANHSITLTFLSKVTFGSLNGSDNDVDNINSIKKITLPDGKELPYMSSQALRRALRDRLTDMGEIASPISIKTKKIDGEVKADSKAPAYSTCDPESYIDDDLFGFMRAEKKNSKQRTSPVRIDALVALTTYQGDLDFGTNLQGKELGKDPNPFETEIHSGLYRGTILIELDRVGRGYYEKEKYFSDDYIDNSTKAERVKKLLTAVQTLWSSGRQSRFLADISPKFVAAAWMSAKAPVFLEAVRPSGEGVDLGALESVTEDYGDFISEHVYGAQAAVVTPGEGVQSMKEAFDTMRGWVDQYYG
jgi:CRISPR-associated protein Cst2